MYNDRREISKNSPLRQMIIDKILFRNLLDKGEKILMVAHVTPSLFMVRFQGCFWGYSSPPLAIFVSTFVAHLDLLGRVWGLTFGYRILQWYLDAWIITNLAVIDHEWNSFVDQTTNQLSTETSMPFQMKLKVLELFTFGNIQITHMSGAPRLGERNISSEG